MILYLQEHIKKYLTHTPSYFEQLMLLKGELFRHREGRKTQRICLGNINYFIKQHTGIRWKEIFKNLLQLRLPILSARNEWRAIFKLKSLGIPVPHVVAFGQRGFNPAHLQSFILMEELAPTISLEKLCKNWSVTPPSFLFKKALIERVAKIAKLLHENGINHRDFYICHFMLDTSTPFDEQSPYLYLIDLHRAHIRRNTPLRWIIKDLASLYFSSKEVGLTQRDSYRFIQYYCGKPLREVMPVKKTFWDKIIKRGEKLYAGHK